MSPPEPEPLPEAAPPTQPPTWGVDMEFGQPYELDGVWYRNIVSTHSDGFVCLNIGEWRGPPSEMQDPDAPIVF